jgi:putative transport protein
MQSLDLLMGTPLFALFTVIAVGLLLGSVKVKGLSLGSSGVLFSGLLCGHYGYSVPDAAGTIGLILFVYCVGISAGSRFFSALAKEGSTLAKMGLLIVAVAALAAWFFQWALGIPKDLAVGLFAGAMTSTPALAAATEGMGQAASQVIVGYGIAYPFGVVGVVLFVQLAPRWLRQDLDKEAQEYDGAHQQLSKVQTVLVEVLNPALAGRRISEAAGFMPNACQLSRRLEGDRLVPLKYDDVFVEGQHLLLVGRPKELEIAIHTLGRKSDRPHVKDVENERQRLVLTVPRLVGMTLQQLEPLKSFGVMVTRITRLDVTFVPSADTQLELRDVLTVVGNPEDLKRFGDRIGHRDQAFDETDLLSLSIGLSLGILAGMVPLGLKGGESITLGMAGGPLFVALILGHFGRVGRLVGHIPRPTRQLLQELGLVFFLANAGVKGGASMVQTVAEYGPVLFLAGAGVTLLPMLLLYPLSKRLFGLNALASLGGICGGMTSTPALGALTARIQSQLPVVSYATAYPVALIFMTVAAKVLMALMN